MSFVHTTQTVKHDSSAFYSVSIDNVSMSMWIAMCLSPPGEREMNRACDEVFSSEDIISYGRWAVVRGEASTKGRGITCKKRETIDASFTRLPALCRASRRNWQNIQRIPPFRFTFGYSTTWQASLTSLYYLSTLLTGRISPGSHIGLLCLFKECAILQLQ